MKMRLSKIALAVASLGTAQVAFALTPAQIAAGPTTYVWLSGASAPTNARVPQRDVALQRLGRQWRHQ